MKATKMRLGDIEERRTLNPRDHLSHERIQEYCRRLQNGELPPPLEIHEGKRVLFAGALRFHAWKEFLGEGWQDHEIDVILREDLPDPDDNPETFRVEAAIHNRDNGQPHSRFEKRRVVVQLADKQGQEVALSYAKGLNETEDTLRQLMQTMAKPAMVLMEATTAAPKGSDSSETQTPISHAVRYGPGSFPTGHLQGFVPGIRRLCRELRRELDAHQGMLAEVDRAELEQTVEAIRLALEVAA